MELPATAGGLRVLRKFGDGGRALGAQPMAWRKAFVDNLLVDRTKVR